MLSSLEKDIRGLIARYISREVSLREFQECFAPRVWDIDSTGDASAAQLAGRIELFLAEFSSGDWTEEELRKKLSEYAPPPQAFEIRVDFHESPWLQIVTSSVLGNQIADSTKYIGAIPLFESPRIQVSEPTVTEHAR